MLELEHPPRNVNELQEQLTELGVTVSIRTLERWAEQGLIPRPTRHGLGKGKGSSSERDERALCRTAGVWILRNGSEKNWSRKTIDEKTVKQVQCAASKIYKKPAIRLSLPFNTKDEDDPPLDAVDLTFMCAPTLERFLKPYLRATEKVRHGYHVKDAPATITFEWADLSKQGQTKRRLPFTSQIRWDVEFVKTTIAKAPDRKDELRVLVDGKDVRKYLLAMRREDRIIRLAHPDICERWHWRIATSYALFFAGEEIRNVGYDKPTRRKIHKDYKGSVSEGELQIRKNLAEFQEMFGVPAEVDEQFFKEIASEVTQKLLRIWINRLQDKIKHDRLDNSSVNTDLLSLSSELKNVKGKTIISEAALEELRKVINLFQNIIEHDQLDNLSTNTALLLLSVFSAKLKKEKEKTILLNTLV